MNILDLDTDRIHGVLTMFSISQGELARASRISPAMICLVLTRKKRPSARTAVALIEGLEKLLVGRRLDTAYFLRPPDAARVAPSG